MAESFGFRPLYICREPSTNQLFIMQNEPNLLESQMNVTKVLTRDYVNKTLGERGKNEPKTNPIKANFKKAQTNVNKVLTKDYENKSSWAIYENKANTKPIQTQSNPMLVRHLCGGTKAKKCCRV